VKHTSIKAIAGAIALNLSIAAPTQAAQHHHQHGLSAPIGIMGDHVMPEGNWMLSYRLMSMTMEGNRTGTDRVATPLPGYMVSPLSMDMDMHMLGGMYGYSDDVTIMVMAPFISNEMDMLMNMSSTTFSRDSSGVGDVKLSATYKFGGNGSVLNAGLSLPTGSIDEKTQSPMMGGGIMQMPYPMQLGSGTFDLLLGATHVSGGHDMTWGVQGMATIRTGDNDNGYTLGNVINLNAWVSKSLTDTLAGSFRLNARDTDNIDGADPQINASMAPTGDPNLRGGTRVDAVVGINASFGIHTIGLEYAVPVHQDLDGPQLETDSVITLGIVSQF